MFMQPGDAEKVIELARAEIRTMKAEAETIKNARLAAAVRATISTDENTVSRFENFVKNRT